MSEDKKMYIFKLNGTPKGVQKFKGVPIRRYMNKARFYTDSHKFAKFKIHFSTN